MTIKQKTREELEGQARKIRIDIIEMLEHAGSGHSAGPLGLADVFTALYFSVLKHNPREPFWDERDRLCLSCGHVVPVRYVTMAHAGYFPKEELKTLRALGSPLQGHPSRHDMPEIEHSSGPLGQGASVSIGMAIAAKLQRKTHNVFCVLSDGEQQEGQVWEAAMLANREKLGNLIWIIDDNNIQIDGHTEDIMPVEPLTKKYEAFGWHTQEINGNIVQEVIDACERAKSEQGSPSVIIAKTVPGKGVSFMENKPEWHGRPPTKEEAKQALQELSRGKI